MKKVFLIALVLSVFSASFMIGGDLHVDVYPVDVNASSLEWNAAKFSGKHNGTVSFSSGEIHSNHGNLSGTFEIDMNTIKDLDIKDEAMNTKLTNHLKSADFFDVAKYPKAKYVITSVVPNKELKEGGATHRVHGNLTIKDKTNPLSFDATIITQDAKITCVGSAVVDRSK
ncbi:MAG: YceI family protein, partial [Bacteroidia bacterium]|nr:YceI family protein [Bacteroidia bacterium]